MALHTDPGIIARRAGYSWAFAGYIIFWLSLFIVYCPKNFPKIVKKPLFDSFRYWYGWVFSDSLIETSISGKNKSFRQISPAVSCRVFRPSATVSRIGLVESRLHHCCWCGGPPPPPSWLAPWLADPPPWLADPPGWLHPPHVMDGWGARPLR